MKAAEILKTMFEKIINMPNSSYATNPTVGEKREWMLPFLFGKKFKSGKVLPCGFHLSANEESEPNPLRECDFPDCQRQDPHWRVFKGCGHSFHVVCVPQSTCPTCQDGIRRRVRENAQKAKQAIFSQSPVDGKTSTDPSLNAQDKSDKDDAGLPEVNGKEVEERLRQINAEIRSWPKYTPSTGAPASQRQPAPQSKQGHQVPENKGSRPPMSGRRFNFRAAIQEFVEKCCGEKPTDHQIKHLLGSDMRLTGETFERVKRKILALMKTKQKQMKKHSASLLTVHPGEVIFHTKATTSRFSTLAPLTIC